MRGLLDGDGFLAPFYVEADETFGNERKPRRQGKKGRGYEHKTKVLSLVERGGRVRSFHVPAVNAKTLGPILKEQIAEDTKLMTDEAGQYKSIGPYFDEHGVVTHSIGEYVRGDIHTNIVEGYLKHRVSCNDDCSAWVTKLGNTLIANSYLSTGLQLVD